MYQVTQPRSVSFGDSDWIILEWEHLLQDPQKGAIRIKGQQYYSKNDSQYTLIEVSVMGPKEFFDTAGIKEIYGFLTNAKIESRSTNEIDAIKRIGESELEKKSQPISSAEIVGIWEMVYHLLISKNFQAFLCPGGRETFLVLLKLAQLALGDLLLRIYLIVLL